MVKLLISWAPRRIISGARYAFSEDAMALLALITSDEALPQHLQGGLHAEHELACATTWDGLVRLVRERPVSAVVVDGSLLEESVGPSWNSGLRHVSQLKRLFPSVGILVLWRPEIRGQVLFRLGSRVRGPIRLLPVSHIHNRLCSEIRRSLDRSAPALVMSVLRSQLSADEEQVLQEALSGLHRRYSAEAFAASRGMTRPALSERLKGNGLIPVGRLLLWSRLLHAAVWLCEPGRTADSVARQLEYSTGAAFRRALREHTGATPTEVIDRGGLPFVLTCFTRDCNAGRDRVVLRAS